MLQPVPAETAPQLNPTLGFSDEECQAMQRAIINLFGHWKLSDSEAVVLLGGISLKTYRRWRSGEYRSARRL